MTSIRPLVARVFARRPPPLPRRCQPAPDSARARHRTASPTLPEISVTVTRTPEPLDRVPSRSASSDQGDLQRGQPTLGLDEALNNIPGVVVANRYNFSLDQRISIRGFGSRSNFGVRGLKILLDGVPQTLPDGQSQLTNVDFGDHRAGRGAARRQLVAVRQRVGRRHLARRPSAAAPAPFAHAGPVRGRRRQAGRTTVLQVAELDVGPVRQRERHALALAVQGRRLPAAQRGRDPPAQRRRGLRVLAARRSGPCASAPPTIPTAENPGRAHLRRVPGQARLGRGQQHPPRRRQGRPAAAALARPEALRRRAATSRRDGVRRCCATWRIRSPRRRRAARAPTVGTYVTIDRAVGGAAAQRQPAARRRRAMRLGSPRVPTCSGCGTTGRISARTRRADGQRASSTSGRRSPSSGRSPRLHWSPDERLLVSGGARYDWVRFDVDDHHLTDGVDNSGARTMSALSGSLGAELVVRATRFIPYANVSTSFETPTTTELVNQPDGAGGFNTELKPQRAVNYEVGARGRPTARVQLLGGALPGRITDAIVQQQEVGGRAFFVNAGKTHNDGVEVGLTVTPVNGLTLSGAYT